MMISLSKMFFFCEAVHMKIGFLNRFMFLIGLLVKVFGTGDGLIIDRTIFHRGTFFRNRVITNFSLWSKSDISSEVACASECVTDSKCVSFFYNRATDLCTGHAVQFYGTEPTQEAEETYYYTTNVDQRDCAEILSNDEESEDGVYTINPLDGKGAFQVYCDMSTEDGGWTVFQRRRDGSVDFYKNWTDYKAGFGSPDGEFWLGNDNIHRLSIARGSVLRIDMMDQEDETGYAEYTNFYIDSELDKYRLHINVYTGDRGDSLRLHNNKQFSTKDSDNDDSPGACAVGSRGAWWYHKCHGAHLNGNYGSSTYGEAITWYYWHGHAISLKKTEMKMRPS